MTTGRKCLTYVKNGTEIYQEQKSFFFSLLFEYQTLRQENL